MRRWLRPEKQNMHENSPNTDTNQPAKGRQLPHTQDSPASDPELNNGGSTGKHPEIELLPILVSPTFGGKGKNTIRMELIPVACWRINDVRFGFGDSFVLPNAQEEFQQLLRLRKEHPGAPLSVFGHSDPAGDDAVNKRLSGHRAEAVYAVLIRDTARWEKLFHVGGGKEGWGTASIQHMLGAVGYDPGPVNGVIGFKTRKAIEQFQGDSGLLVDGVVGPEIRAKLFAGYMDFLCPEKLDKRDFLAKGADPEGKGDVQGCGEFNPMMVFSLDEEKTLSKPENKQSRETKNAVNRRVLVLLFRPGGTPVPVEKWPCPRTSEGVEACHKRFWSDGNARRFPQSMHREFGQTQDTFACRFYHRLVIQSPCEGVPPPPPKDSHWIEIEMRYSTGMPAARVRYLIKLPDGGAVTGQLDRNGRARLQNIPEGRCLVTFPDLDGNSWDDA